MLTTSISKIDTISTRSAFPARLKQHLASGQQLPTIAVESGVLDSVLTGMMFCFQTLYGIYWS